ncbi:MAG TPA: hybrid sensor histidine kinase/response regulator [Candidatus Omnitrophota bacterium]|nr:hybrid sensor histidine kinase/response regulator [Candidatus Omnitrophota bacterium]HPS20632.1 hybrid sensor histidine kinase/response regulator [Candidatus Omnitrophota bacterium]
MEEIDLMVIDDEVGILSALVRSFRSEKIKIYTNVSAKEALKVAAANKVKVVLSDYKMPEMSGVELLGQVKQMNPDIVRILFTGYADIKIVEEAINRGEVYRFINKPWEEAELKTIIFEAIDRYDIKDKNKRLQAELLARNAELLQLTDKLSQMYEAQKEFSSVISHELRTPLAAIKASIDVVVRGTAGALNAEQLNFLNKAKVNMDRLGRIVNEVLDYSKIEAGEYKLNVRTDNINRVICDVAEGFSAAAKEKGLEIYQRLSDDVKDFNFDVDRVVQVLNNLVSNAVKFTDKGGITVSSGMAPSEMVTVSVRDSGIGIAQEDIPKLFKRFQQLGAPGERKYGGTGLGLAISKEIIKMHGGDIFVESKTGEGSVFTFTLPSTLK